MGDHGVGPCASFLSGKRSTAELVTQNSYYTKLRRVPESDRRIEVLQTPALPLRQRAKNYKLLTFVEVNSTIKYP